MILLLDTKSIIFVILGSSLTMAIFSSSSNLVSAAIECFGQGSLDHYFCTATVGEGPDAESFTIECSKDNNGQWSCTPLNRKATPPGIEQVIQDSINEVGPSNTNDPKDLGGIKSDKPITKNPVE